jgi:hypothetical protein
MVDRVPAFILVSLLLIGSCDSKKQNAEVKSAAATTPSPPAANPTPAAPPPPSPPDSITLEQMGLVHQGLPLNKLNDPAWESESLNDAAGRQLSALGKLLTEPGKLSEAAVAPFLAPAFRSSSLRPENLETVFADGQLLVRRAPGPAQASPTTPADFVQSMQKLFADYPEAAEIHVKFKVFRVTLDRPLAETTVRVELVAEGKTASLQQTAEWRCQWQGRDGEEPLLASVVLDAFEETRAGEGGPRFVDCTEAVLSKDAAFRDQLAYGLDHWVARIEQQFVSGPSGWEGFAMGDANGDGLEDLYVCQPGGLPKRLFLQNADGTLTDHARESGVDWWDQSQAALFCDFDNDGDQDLAIAMIWGVLFMANDGRGQFAVAAAKLSPEGMPHSLAAADFDADGDVDVYVCCYSKRAGAVKQRFLARPIPYHDANNGSRNILFRNDRQWRFRDATKAVGLDENNNKFSFAAAWDDFDGDDDLDLYVANDFGRDNLYRCDRAADGTVHFKDVGASAGVDDISAGMSVAWGDADNDGRPDIYVSNMWSSAGNRIAYQPRFHQAGSAEALASFQRHARGNTLFVNAGDGTFRDVSEPAGVTMGRWAWGSRFVDLNNDGWEDLVVANGYITQEDSGDL